MGGSGEKQFQCRQIYTQTTKRRDEISTLVKSLFEIVEMDDNCDCDPCHFCIFSFHHITSHRNANALYRIVLYIRCDRLNVLNGSEISLAITQNIVSNRFIATIFIWPKRSYSAIPRLFTQSAGLANVQLHFQHNCDAGTRYSSYYVYYLFCSFFLNLLLFHLVLCASFICLVFVRACVSVCVSHH